ncbi:PDDEXK family nuclease [Kitasatospora cathayae]|uniref:Uncharacterized protein n=1 Tax=Kitasatospora cathayae TaxID=3004092 RepID=A0ABY7QIV7_9ACTN|nr:hypothetical protein [Kitasatospora sp. HUAS 3-15]WBP92179.1 hypothetical protein O1G21_41270 [Kitasatospora sp. HUAS 3-15]
MTTIQPIETRYAGHHFRSRLEARWAVFFDAIGITWEYEPQGYTVGLDRRPYLPDFWLPDLHAFVEVKGDEERFDGRLLSDLLRYGGDAVFVLALGQIPHAELGRAPVHAAFIPTSDFYQPASPSIETVERAFAAIRTLDESDQAAVKELIHNPPRIAICCQHFVFQCGKDADGKAEPLILPIFAPNAFTSVKDILNPNPAWFVLQDRKVIKAYEAARSARFEHGESGPTV